MDAVPRERRLWLIAIGLVVVGIGLAVSGIEALRAPGDAFIIAGVLAVTVDRYVKLRLRDEIAHDVFFAALGVDLPEELKEEILAIGECKLVRRGMDITYKLTPADDLAYLCCETRVEFAMENLTNSAQEFTHSVWVSDAIAGADNPKFPILLVKGALPDTGYCLQHEKISLTDRDHGREWHRTVHIPGKSTVKFWTTTQQILPAEFEETFILAQPTIGVTVRIDCPPQIHSTVVFHHRLCKEPDPQPHDTWKVDAAFFPNSIIRTCWSRRTVAEQPVQIGPRRLHLRSRARSQSGTAIETSVSTAVVQAHNAPKERPPG